MKNILQKLIDYVLLATLIIFPLSVNIALISPNDPGHPLVAINFSLTDMFIGPLLVLWVMKLIVFKEWKQLKLPPLSILVLVVVVLISFVNATSMSVWAKESIQTIEYFILFYLLLLNNFKSIKRKTIFYAFYLSTSILLLISFIQHTVLDADVYLVRGLFENRNFLGAYLCMVIPFVYIEFISSKKLHVKIWMASLLITSVWILVSGSALIALVIALALVSWKYGKKLLLRYLVFIIIISSIYPFVLPSKNVPGLKNFFSIYEQGSINENYYRRLTMLGDKGKRTLLHKEMGDNYIQITIGQYFEPSLPGPKKGERYKDMEDKKHIKNRYLEMQASLNMISENTLLGVGAGNFQDNIGICYKELPKVNTAEPGQNNGYLVIGSTLGIFGLSSLIWVFFSILKDLQVKNIDSFEKREQVVRLGLFGSVLSCMIVNFFVYILSASLMVPFIFLIYLSFNNTNSLNDYES